HNPHAPLRCPQAGPSPPRPPPPHTRPTTQRPPAARVAVVNTLAALVGADPRLVRRVVRVIAVLALVVVLALVAPTWWSQVRPGPGWAVPADRVAVAATALTDLPMVPEPQPLTDYDRDHFGPPWFDTDGNGCDTRNDQLTHWLTDVAYDPVQPCVVVSGVLHDPYTG